MAMKQRPEHRVKLWSLLVCSMLEVFALPVFPAVVLHVLPVHAGLHAEHMFVNPLHLLHFLWKAQQLASNIEACLTSSSFT